MIAIYKEYEEAAAELEKVTNEAEKSYDRALSAKNDEVEACQDQLLEIEMEHRRAIEKLKAAEEKLIKFNLRNAMRREELQKIKIKDAVEDARGCSAYPIMLFNL